MARTEGSGIRAGAERTGSPGGRPPGEGLTHRDGSCPKPLQPLQDPSITDKCWWADLRWRAGASSVKALSRSWSGGGALRSLAQPPVPARQGQARMPVGLGNKRVPSSPETWSCDSCSQSQVLGLSQAPPGPMTLQQPWGFVDPFFRCLAYCLQ